MTKRRGHGEGSIYQRADGRWAGVLDLGWKDGKRRRKTVYAKTRNEAARKLRRTQQAHDAGLPIIDERTTVEDYLQWWLLEAAATTVRATTLASYESKVRCHIVPSVGKVRLAKLNATHVQKLITDKLQSGLSPRTVQYIHAILRRALGQAEKWGLVAKNVAKLVDAPRVTRQEVRYLSRSEAQRFLDVAANNRLYALYAVAVGLGLRQGEALGLRWEHIDLDEHRLHVKQQLQRINGQFEFVTPKSAKSSRSLPIPEVCAKALRAHRAHQLEERLAAGDRWREHDLVFTTTIGTPIDARNLTRGFKKICAETGIEDLRFHDLRHTCATILLAQDVPTRVVMEILGHSQMSLTTDTYQHVLPELKQEAANQIDNVFSEAESA